MPRQLKDPSVRQRRNVAASRATLYPLKPGEIDIPPLANRVDKEGNEIPWSPGTLRYWTRIWSSPMASEFHAQSDIEGLYRLAALVELFWLKPSAMLNAEIRQYEAQFGLNPLARRRLEWVIVGTERAQDEAAERKQRRVKASRPPAKSGEGSALTA